MARRRLKFRDALTGVSIAVIGLLVFILSNPVVLVFIAAGVTFWLVHRFQRRRRAEKERELERQRTLGLIKSATEKTARLASEHREALHRNYRRLATLNDYGVRELAPWRKEAEKFFEQVVVPKLTEDERRCLARSDLRLAIDDESDIELLGTRTEEISLGEFQLITIHDIASESPPGRPPSAYREDMSGTDYELFVANELRALGWRARLSRPGPDQGADVIAERDGEKVVIQCKKYRQPVGNSAVQEAATARLHVGARRAAVVSNSTFTPAARRLAATNAVVLLHHQELDRL